MRSNSGVYVDAGYPLAAAGTRITGTSLRNVIDSDLPSLFNALYADAEKIAGLHLADALNTNNLGAAVRTQLRRRFWEIVDQRVE